jgi:hypothetical protein
LEAFLTLINAFRIRYEDIDYWTMLKKWRSRGNCAWSFQSELAEYCLTKDIDERVFTITSIKALRLQVKMQIQSCLGGTELSRVWHWEVRLTQEGRFQRCVSRDFSASNFETKIPLEAVGRRLPLLDPAMSMSWREKINSRFEPGLEIVTQIRDEFKQKIIGVRDSKSRAIADSFRFLRSQLRNTFETDFLLSMASFP